MEKFLPAVETFMDFDPVLQLYLVKMKTASGVTFFIPVEHRGTQRPEGIVAIILARWKRGKLFTKEDSMNIFIELQLLKRSNEDEVDGEQIYIIGQKKLEEIKLLESNNCFYIEMVL